ncbi:MAG: tetratricopeptide repeat protein [Kiloniellales bacterium]|nr:tetratricopeptide repeat protein [Kiloniellales bacterium]
MPRWLLIGLLIAATALAGVSLFDMRRVTVPDACVTADEALRAQDYNRAIDHYLLCLDAGDYSDPVLAQVYYALGVAYSGKGNHYQAIEDYSRSLEFAPDNAWAYNNRCWSYGLLRRAEEALADCEEAVRLLPDEAAILDSRALAHWLLDDHDKARQDLERARELDPSFPAWDARFREFEGFY